MNEPTISELVDAELERREFYDISVQIARGWIIETLVSMGKCDRCHFCGGYTLDDYCTYCGNEHY